MILNFGNYYSKIKKAATLPHVLVTREEFIRLLIADGQTPEKAEQTVHIAEQLGSDVMVGENMVGLAK